MSDRGTAAEKLGEKAKVTSTILRAYMAWTRERWGDATLRLDGHLDPPTAAILRSTVGPNRRILFRDLVAITKAIAAADGTDAEEVYRELGRYSARVNMAGAYEEVPSPDEPHNFFDQMDHLHKTFQNFGQSRYTRTGDRSGQIRLEGYTEFSPVYCRSGLGYYEQALEMMKTPGPVTVVESSCQCRGAEACVFELNW
jgi:hypothetical protein